MLVLSRKKNESVVIGPDPGSLARITIIEIRGDKVRLGFEVPREWCLHRQEVYDAIARENAEDQSR